MLSLALASVNNLAAGVVAGDWGDRNRACDFISNALAARRLWLHNCFEMKTG